MPHHVKNVRITALKIVGLYALLGYVWLAAFDEAMDVLDLRVLEPYADLIFMAASSLIFYVVLVAYIGRHDRIQQALTQQEGLAQQTRLEHQHNTALRTLNAELGRSNAELEEFAYVASHDLRQPLRMVSSYLTLTQRHLQNVLDDDSREYMGFAREGADRMDRLITDLLEYSRVGRGEEVPEPVDLNRVVVDVIATLALELEGAGGRVEVNASLPTIMSTPLEMGQLFQNLIANAVKYRHPERPPVVSVAARQVGEHWEIVVADNGIGIAPEHRERIFGVFQRLHDHKSFEGSGIGLAIAKKVVERHGGSILIRSAAGAEGSEFVIALPVEPCQSATSPADHLLRA